MSNAAFARNATIRAGTVYISSMEVLKKLRGLGLEAERVAWMAAKAVIFESGTKVTDKQEKARKAICDTSEGGKPCKYRGMVKPFDGKLELPGCTHCGCPFETKRKMKTVLGENVTCPLSRWVIDN